MLQQIPNDEGLLQAFSIALHESAPQWLGINDYCILMEALMDRGLLSDAKRLTQAVIPKADSPAYYTVIDSLLKHRLFDEAEVLTDNLMRRFASLELQAYWLEISTRSGKQVSDRLSQFLYGISYDQRGELLNKLNALGNQPDRFHNATLAWIADRISEQVPTQPPSMDSSRQSSWPVYFLVICIILTVSLAIAAYISINKATTTTNIATSTKSSEPRTPNAITGLRTANVTSLRFFESPGDAPPYNQRTYQDRVARGTARYIYWELNLKHPKPTRRVDFAINAVWHGPDNAVLAEQTYPTHLNADWTTSYHNMNWGWPEAGHWQIGHYTVDLYIEDVRVASGSFEVYAEDRLGQPEINRGEASAQLLGNGQLALHQGSWVQVNMAGGLQGVPVQGGGFYYGYYEHINIPEAYRGRTLTVATRAGTVNFRIEVWRGSIDGRDHSWWNHHEQVALSTGTEARPAFESTPHLEWTIDRGEYTLFFASFSVFGEVPNSAISARLNIDR